MQSSSPPTTTTTTTTNKNNNLNLTSNPVKELKNRFESLSHQNQPNPSSSSSSSSILHSSSKHLHSIPIDIDSSQSHHHQTSHSYDQPHYHHHPHQPINQHPASLTPRSQIFNLPPPLPARHQSSSDQSFHSTNHSEPITPTTHLYHDRAIPLTSSPSHASILPAVAPKPRAKPSTFHEPRQQTTITSPNLTSQAPPIILKKRPPPPPPLASNSRSSPSPPQYPSLPLSPKPHTPNSTPFNLNPGPSSQKFSQDYNPINTPKNPTELSKPRLSSARNVDSQSSGPTSQLSSRLRSQSPPPVAPRPRPPWPTSLELADDQPPQRQSRLHSVNSPRSARMPNQVPLVIPRSAPPIEAHYPQNINSKVSQPQTAEDPAFGHRYTTIPPSPLSPTLTSSPFHPISKNASTSPPPAVPARPPPSIIMMPIPSPTGHSPTAVDEVFQHRAPHPPRLPSRKPSIPFNSPANHYDPSNPRRISFSTSPRPPSKQISSHQPAPVPPPRPRSLSSSSSHSNLNHRIPPSRQLPHPPLPSSKPGSHSTSLYQLPSAGPPPSLPDRIPRAHAPVGPREWADERLVYQAPEGTYHSSLIQPRKQSEKTSGAPPVAVRPPPTRNVPMSAPVLIRKQSSRSTGYDSDEYDYDDGPIVASTGNMRQPTELSAASRATRNGSVSVGPDGSASSSTGNAAAMDEDNITLATHLRADEMPDATFANRRPPFLNPHVAISIGSQFTSFAIRGRYLCTGHHQFKLWNSLTGDCENSVSSLQDVKITALEFKACNSFGDEKVGGNACRYVWCGAKDGQLFEYDCFERRMIDSKASLHSASIIGIFRCKFGGMCTLDETAKVQIWTNPISPKIGVKISGTARAQRVADKTNFAAMLSHQLWTSSGPSGSKSASTLAQRSPSIRVYDPDPTQAWTVTPRPLSIPDNGTVIGAVTAGAVIPSTPSIVYLGHDTGHVSIWNNKEEKNGGVGFKKLIKISNYQITALEGVTKYLWAGFRTGNVYVYDTCEKQQDEAGSGGGGWKVLKVWKAHKESITRIVVDPSLLWDDEASKLHVATTSTDWKVKLWDGTMGADWIATEMRKRESEFCAYRPMRVLICSWNIDACKPNELTGTSDNLNFLDDVLKSSEESPDVIVFGFQEMIDLDNKKLTAKTVLLGGRKKGAEKLSDAVSQSYRLWHDRLVAAVRLAMPPDEPYVVAHTQNLVGLFTCVFVKVSERAKMRDIAITTVKTGMKGRYGNKGAIIARFVVDDSSICFINCHLAAGQKNLRQRHEDLIDILEEKSGFPDPPESSSSGTGGAIGNAYVGGGNGSAIADHEICFLYGDLNYRIDRGREEVIRAIASGEYLKLLEDDQLRKEKRFNAGFRLKSFREAPITFHPTYKYDPGTHMYDSSEKNRVPAWCDRILYRTPNTNQEMGVNQSEEIKSKPMVTCLNYKRYEVNISDHRPISGTFLVSVKSIVPGLRRGIWQEVLGRWKAYEVDVKEVARGYYSGL